MELRVSVGSALFSHFVCLALNRVLFLFCRGRSPMPLGYGQRCKQTSTNGADFVFCLDLSGTEHNSDVTSLNE